MDVEAAAEQLLKTIFVENRTTPADKRDFTAALKMICDLIETETVNKVMELIQGVEPHRFPGNDSAIEMASASIQAVYYRIAHHYERPYTNLDLQQRQPEPLGLALQEAAQELDSEPKD